MGETYFLIFFMFRFFVAVLGFVLMLVILKYRLKIKDFIGDIAFAEKYLGSGGTFTLLILIAIGVFFLSLMYALGTLDTFVIGVIGRFFGA